MWQAGRMAGTAAVAKVDDDSRKGTVQLLLNSVLLLVLFLCARIRGPRILILISQEYYYFAERKASHEAGHDGIHSIPRSHYNGDYKNGWGVRWVGHWGGHVLSI